MHAVLQRDEGVYVAECLEVAVVTQGRTADEVLSNLQEAIALHLEGEDLQALGLSEEPRLVVTYEVPMARHGAEA
ncbi:MAG: type II toxin-antitoxin system HicB family antitoxin [Deltaproteobacteria bacterium]|nr:MAG: type II toxin-antitoxin system HicB family antitoxin [Deltaproteobacteria bacterium]